jgi:signal transduction histidine kinase
VSGLLNFARKNRLNYSIFNIKDFVKHCISSLIIPENVKVTFNSEISDKIAEIDPDQWMQILVNIGKNAIEALPEDGGTRQQLCYINIT